MEQDRNGRGNCDQGGRRALKEVVVPRVGKMEKGEPSEDPQNGARGNETKVPLKHLVR